MEIGWLGAGSILFGIVGLFFFEQALALGMYGFLAVFVLFIGVELGYACLDCVRVFQMIKHK